MAEQMDRLAVSHCMQRRVDFTGDWQRHKVDVPGGV